jgi:hypothetical protein
MGRSRQQEGIKETDKEDRNTLQEISAQTRNTLPKPATAGGHLLNYSHFLHCRIYRECQGVVNEDFVWAHQADDLWGFGKCETLFVDDMRREQWSLG